MLQGIIISVGLASIGAALWGLVCNNRTHRERTLIANVGVFGHADWRERVVEYDRVTYDEHLKALFLFRNPWALYSQRIREAVGK